MERKSSNNTAVKKTCLYHSLFLVDEGKPNPLLKVLMAWKNTMWCSCCFRTASNCEQVCFTEQTFKKEDKLKKKL